MLNFYSKETFQDVIGLGTVLFITGQALGVLTVVFGIINYQVKTREQVLFIHILTTLTFVLHYFCLGAWAGMAMNFIGFVRNITFYYLGKNGKVSRFWAIFFAAALGASGLVASLVMREGWYFVFSVVGVTINSYAMSFKNPQHIRESILVTSPLVLTYDVFATSYGGVVYESVAILSALIGIIRYRKRNDA